MMTGEEENCFETSIENEELRTCGRFSDEL